MKKITLVLTLAIFAISLQINAQICNPPCTPDVSCVEIDNPGEVCPVELPPATAGVFYDETVTVIPPATYQGLPVIHSIKITAVTGLPTGMTWCKSEDIFLVTSPATRYCCQLSGTTNQVGVYPLTLTIVPYIKVLGVPVPQAAVTDDTSLTIIVLPAIQAPVAAFSANPTTTEINSDVMFTDLSTNVPTQWAWTFENGNPPTSPLPNPTVQWTAAGSYNVSLTATNAGGNNTMTKTDYILITDHTGINDALNGNVKIYPNPASNELTVEAANMKSITILDILGKVVYTSDVTSEKTTIDISKLNKANYFIKVRTAEGEITKTISIK